MAQSERYKVKPSRNIQSYVGGIHGDRQSAHADKSSISVPIVSHKDGCAGCDGNVFKEKETPMDTVFNNTLSEKTRTNVLAGFVVISLWHAATPVFGTENHLNIKDVGGVTASCQPAATEESDKSDFRIGGEIARQEAFVTKDATRPRIVGEQEFVTTDRLATTDTLTTGTLTGNRLTSLPVPKAIPVEFIVSQNHDHDPDPAGGLLKTLNPTEDNLRPVTMAAVAGAATVQIVNADQLRLWQTRNKKVNLKAKYRLPFKFMIEGRIKSKKINDRSITFIYFDKTGKKVCDGSLIGTVINVRAELNIAKGGGTSLKAHWKMLGNAQAQIKGLKEPGYEPAYPFRNKPEWTYALGKVRHPGGKHMATPKRLNTKFSALLGATPTTGKYLLKRVFQGPGEQKIEAVQALRIVLPLHARVTNPDAFRPGTTKPFTTHPKGGIKLFSTKIKYEIQDQYREPINQAAYGKQHVFIRENIGTVMNSPIPGLQQWIDGTLNWTENWKKKDSGEIEDTLSAKGLPEQTLTGPNNRFHRIMGQEGATVIRLSTPQGGARHIWQVGVGPKAANVVAERNVTNNTFSVTAGPSTRRQQGTIIDTASLNYRYVVVTP